MELELIIGFFLAITLGPPIAFLIAGLALNKKKPNRAKIFLILAGVYLLVAGGICFGIMS
ncbi:MAG TPA: hypothetical protein PK325_13785 [Cyclobacteriaceae bacterium]|nr:hypothetical protein [Cyclobacteriaceae bacterium]HMV10864.1 hypothetical protein [Cyclobacteriaceae bacterium]HMV88907.1 hypothetical protein [Cyclobacteriaceae bacterium]HMW99695.1 hypothetical protein [Cyclobacteriaceae bacterium]HMX51987.1 hypothetical protein [Cyclobacteriaceae bacterium]